LDDTLSRASRLVRFMHDVSYPFSLYTLSPCAPISWARRVNPTPNLQVHAPVGESEYAALDSYIASTAPQPAAESAAPITE
jgi:hypothetical protein